MEYYSAVKRDKLLTHDMDELRKHYATVKKPDTKGHITYL